MSVIGTGVAAGVAQSGHQAQQVGRREHRARSEAADAARRVRQMLESHLESLAEDDATSLTQLRIDDQVPEHERGTAPLAPESRRVSRPAAVDPAAPAPPQPPNEAPSEPTPKSDDDDGPLYQHLDITV